MENFAPQHRPLTLAEEIANGISQGVGLLLELLALPFLVLAAIEVGSVRFIIGVNVSHSKVLRATG